VGATGVGSDGGGGGVVRVSVTEQVPEVIARELREAAEYLELDPEEPATWERDLLRAIAAVQRALVHVRGQTVCTVCAGRHVVGVAYVPCPVCRP
jgi:hypothetical protein